MLAAIFKLSLLCIGSPLRELAPQVTEGYFCKT